MIARRVRGGGGARSIHDARRVLRVTVGLVLSGLTYVCSDRRTSEAAVALGNRHGLS